MKNLLQSNIITLLQKKYPDSSILTKKLMELLSIEREAAYRRLRQEVLFPLEELVKIQHKWGFSLDEVLQNEGLKHIYFKLVLFDYLDPSDEELKYIEHLVKRLNNFNSCSNMEYLEISNRLPRALTSGFRNLSKYQIFKWAYQYTNNDALLFSNIIIPERLSLIMSQYYNSVKNVKSTTYVWDYRLFESIVHDIQYFHSADLINDKEKELIKNDLFELLNYMQKVATAGSWLETSNEVKLYISNTGIETNYSQYYSDEFKVCRVHAFAKSEMRSEHPEFIEDFRKWMQLKKKTSVLISQADEKSRIDFFKKQRIMIEEL